MESPLGDPVGVEEFSCYLLFSFVSHLAVVLSLLLLTQFEVLLGCLEC